MIVDSKGREIKVGDRVKAILCVQGLYLKGKEGKVVGIKCVSNYRSGTNYFIEWGVGVEFDVFINGDNCSGRAKDGYGWEGLGKEFEVISNKKLFMTNLKEKFVLAITSEPKKSFRRAGITNGDDVLTDEGTKVFLTWLLHSKFADEFKKDVVDGLLKEEKDSE